MKHLFNPTCDRYGHILTGVGISPQVMPPFVFPTAEEMAFLPGTQMEASRHHIDKPIGPYPKEKARTGQQVRL